MNGILNKKSVPSVSVFFIFSCGCDSLKPALSTVPPSPLPFPPGPDLNACFAGLRASFCFSFWPRGTGEEAEQNEKQNEQQNEKQRLGPALPQAPAAARPLREGRAEASSSRSSGPPGEVFAHGDRRTEHRRNAELSALLGPPGASGTSGGEDPGGTTT